MIKAHVNELGIVMRFDSPADNLSPEEWEALLDELKSHHIPSFYQHGKRMLVEVGPEGKLRAVVYFTPQMVTMDDAIATLKKRKIAVSDVRQNPAGQ